MSSRVISVEDCAPPDFRWLTLKRITWEDPHGRQRTWESAERTTRRGEVDGVAIVAKILRRGRPPVLPVLKQYRPPIANYCLELPAGLVDSGETAGDAAVRELKEETGYSGRVHDVTPTCASDPGMSNANMQYVCVEVDGDAPENQGVKQQLEDGEFIQVELVPWNSLLQHIQDEMARTGCDVDARLLSYAWGIEHAKEAAALAVAAAAKAAAERSAARPIPAAAPPAGPASPTASNGTPQPFGSPVVTAMRTTSSNEPPAMPLEGKPPGATGSSRLAAAPVAPAARQGAARLRSLLPSGSSWLPFAVGVAAGTAGCWLALSRTRSS